MNKVVESQEKDKERIAELFELDERESYKNLTKSISELNGVKPPIILNLAESKGFFVIEHKDGKDVRILNRKDFKPRNYSI